MKVADDEITALIPKSSGLTLSFEKTVDRSALVKVLVIVMFVACSSYLLHKLKTPYSAYNGR